MRLIANRPLRGALLSAALLCLWGCRFSPVPEPNPWSKDLSAQESTISTATTPLAFRVGVLPIQMGFDPRASKNTGTSFASKPDLSGLRKDLLEGLTTLGSFQRVEPRGKPDTSTEDAQALAWAAGDDLVLELTVLDHRVEYIEDASQATWVALYLLWVVPAYWVPVDVYGCHMKVRARLRSLQGDRPPLLDEVYEVRARDRGIGQEYRTLDRGFVGPLDLYALWNVWNSLDEEHWNKIGQSATPHAWRRVLLQAFGDVETTVTRPLRAGGDRAEGVLQQIRKRFALVAGVEHYKDPKIGVARHAVRDARGVAAWWEDSAGGGLVRGRDLTLLVDEEASKASLLSALREVADRAAPGDEVLVYLAGYGVAGAAPVGSASVAPVESDGSIAPVESGGSIAPVATGAVAAGPRAAFLVSDSRSEAPLESGITLGELGEALGSTRASEVLLVFDVSFGPGGGRTWSESAGASAGAEERLLQALRLGPGKVALLAAQPDQAAQVLDAARGGLLTTVLGLGGREKAADQNEDGRVSVAELVAFARREVESRAGLEGADQRPLVLGEAETLRLGWPR